jgi:hypothetical protein
MMTNVSLVERECLNDELPPPDKNAVDDPNILPVLPLDIILY